VLGVAFAELTRKGEGLFLMGRKLFHVGDKVVLTLDKFGVNPGPRAKNIAPSPHGELYSYQVDKYWVVTEVRSDGNLLVKTRRGKTHLVAVDDPRLRKASWLERWFFTKRFPSLNGDNAETPTASQTSSSAA